MFVSTYVTSYKVSNCTVPLIGDVMHKTFAPLTSISVRPKIPYSCHVEAEYIIHDKIRIISPAAFMPLSYLSGLTKRR